jgi:Holliday junction resolvase
VVARDETDGRMSRRGLARLNPKRDANEPIIIQTLEAQGFQVTRINGRGVPDLLVSKRPAFMRLVEVKMPKGRFRPAQLAFKANWRGPAIITLRSVDDALKFNLFAMESTQ